MEGLVRDTGHKTFPIVDSPRVQYAIMMCEWLEQRSTRLELFFLPPYAPVSNAGEYFNRVLKTTLWLGTTAVMRTKPDASMALPTEMYEQVKFCF